jgi:HSP20 family protein
MALVKRTTNWLPSVFNDLVPSVFNDFFGNEWLTSNRSVPAINIREEENGFVVEVAAPGMTKEDCNVMVDDDNNLIISFEKKNESEEKDKKGKYLRREFSYTQFQRTMNLPENAEKDKINAKVENGVLMVEIPVKKEDEKVTKAKRIEIQ